MKPQEYALIVAGGKGARMESEVPKQFLILNGKPILIRTVEAFLRYSEKLKIILVLPEDDFTTWNLLCDQYDFHPPVILQKGGATRFQSVRNGLAKINGDGLVAIHDGVRPLVTVKMIDVSFRLASETKCAVAAVPLKESIRRAGAGPGVHLSVDRSLFRVIQTPQTFDVDLIRKAYQIDEDPSMTDDASVAEQAGNKISLFEGSYANIKITTPEDLIVAEALMAKKVNGDRPE
jgi:2-C-methyl-D-erythritol 4-phosphate cytidylyltransferase